MFFSEKIIWPSSYTVLTRHALCLCCVAIGNDERSLAKYAEQRIF